MKSIIFKRIVTILLVAGLCMGILPSGSMRIAAAESIPFETGEDLGAIGKLFNLLASEALSETSVSQYSIFSADLSADDLLKLRATGTTLSTDEGSFTYVKQASSYLSQYESSAAINFGLDVSSCFKLEALKLAVKCEVTGKDSSTIQLSDDLQYAIYNWTALREKRSVDLSSQRYIQRVWDYDMLDEDFLADVLELTPEAFFSKYGTHIITAYTAGGETYVTYAAQDFSSATSSSSQWTTDVEVPVVDANDAGSMVQELAAASAVSGYKLHQVGGSAKTGFTRDELMSGALDLSAWSSSVTQDNSAILVGDSLNLLPVWELLTDKAYTAKAEELKAYYNEHISADCLALYEQYVNTNVHVEDSFTVWYQSPTGLRMPMAYTPGLTVAQGSVFNAVDLNDDLSKLQFTVTPANAATVDAYGMVTVSGSAANSTTLTVNALTSSGTVKAVRTFTVQSEGGGFFAGGYGTAAQPYLIKSAAQFNNIRNASSSHFLILQNISLGSIAPIDTFTGTLDGNGYTLSGWSYTQTTLGNIGLFRVNSGTIKNMTLSGFAIGNGDPGGGGTLCAGLLCGYNEGTIDNVRVTGGSINVDVGSLDTDSSNAIYAGMLCGQNTGTIKRSGAYGGCKLTTYAGTHYQGVYCYTGGVVGYSSAGTISDVYSHDNSISAYSKADHKNPWIGNCTHGRPDAYSGGVIGYALNTTVQRALGYANFISADAEIVENCSHTEDKAGGSLIGYRSSGCTLTSCYSESADTLIGIGSTTGASQEFSSLTASGIISQLTGFVSNGWIAGSGGHPELSQNSSLTINSQNAKTAYYHGEPLNLDGLVITALKSNSQTGSAVERCYTVSGYDPNKLGTQTVTITYGKVSGRYTVTVSEPPLLRISVSAQPQTRRYFEGESYDFTGLSVVAVYADGSTTQIPDDELTITYSEQVIGENEITVSWGGMTAVFTVDVFDIVPAAIHVQTPGTADFVPGDTFTWEGLSIRVQYNDESEEVLTEGFEVDASAVQMDTPGTYNVQVTYAGEAVSYTITVGAVESITVATLPEALTYYTGDPALDTTGLSLNVVYSNGISRTVTEGFALSGYDLNTTGVQTVTVTFGGAATGYEITVIQKNPVSVELLTTPKTSFYFGDTVAPADVAVTLLVTYNNGDQRHVSEGYTVQVAGFVVNELPQLNVLGHRTVTVSYTENGITCHTEYLIHINAVVVVDLQVVQAPAKSVYKVGETFDPAGMVVNAVYNNGKTETVTDYTVEAALTVSGTVTVTVRYYDQSTTLNVTVLGIQKIAVATLPDKLVYTEGDTIDLTGLVLQVFYEDGSSAQIDGTHCAANVQTLDTVGTVEVTVSYFSAEAAFTVTVNKDPNKPTVTVRSMTTSAGQTITVEIIAQNVPAVKSLMLENFQYDPTLLEYVSGELKLTGGLVSDWDNTNRIATVAFAKNTDINGVMLTLTFAVKSGVEGSCELTFDAYMNRLLEDGTEEQVSLAIVPGTITVTPYLRGDVNGDGYVNSDDSIYLLRHTLFASRYPLNQSGDMNGDDIVNSDDAIYLLRFTLSPSRYPLY